MTPLRTNLIANLVGRIWTALMAIAFVPWYVRLLGLEAFGLVGFFALLQAVCVVLDLGLSTAVTRGLATLTERPGSGDDQRDLVRTFELLNWAIALTLGAGVAVAAPAIVASWINAKDLDPEEAVQAVRLMGLIMAVRWPANLYAGALGGMQSQLSLNLITAGGATVASVGVLGVLSWLSASIPAFFAWQAAIAALQTLVVAWWTWRLLPASTRTPRFSGRILGEQWRFAAGMSAIAVLSVLLSQTDKIILSRMLTLETFGLYALATVVANGLGILVSPIFTAVFPRLSADVARGDQSRLTADYHRACRLMALLILPPALAVSCFAEAVLLAWTGDPAIAEAAGPVLAILLLGTALNSLMMIPYALQLAHGSTRLGLRFNLISAVVVVPLIIAGASHFGPAGAAAVWPLLNLVYVLVGMPMIHRRFLPDAQGRWMLHDTGIPFLAAAAAVAGCALAASPNPSRMVAVAWATSAIVIAYLAAGASSRLASGPLAQGVVDRHEDRG